jgi:hypothetical protein
MNEPLVWTIRGTASQYNGKLPRSLLMILHTDSINPELTGKSTRDASIFLGFDLTPPEDPIVVEVPFPFYSAWLNSCPIWPICRLGTGHGAVRIQLFVA